MNKLKPYAKKYVKKQIEHGDIASFSDIKATIKEAIKTERNVAEKVVLLFPKHRSDIK